MSNEAEPNAWFQFRKPDDNTYCRLFCFPYAGAGASVFKAWQAHLPQRINVVPVQLPGREDRISETPFANLFEAVEKIADALTPLFDRPFAFFGHSMGGKLAFELTRKLSRERGIEPSCLFVAGCRAPHIPEPNPMCQLPREEFLNELSRRYANGTSDEVLKNPELMDLFMPVLRADFALAENYVCPEKEAGNLECPLVVLGGEDDEDAFFYELVAWRSYSSGPFTVRMFPGGHFFIKSQQSRVLRTISEIMAPHMQ